MDFSGPTCMYCQQMYSRYNEPIFITCLCDDVAKHAHGSCFRDYLRHHDYGVCGGCLTRTRIIPDGYKPMAEWRMPKWKPLCGFMERFLTDNRYWKVVYCRETKNRKGNRTIRRYSDVPDKVPWLQNKVDVEEEKEENHFEFEKNRNDETDNKERTRNGDDEPKDYNKNKNKNISNDTSFSTSTSKTSTSSTSTSTDARFKIPTVFVPRGYPYVKKQIEYDNEESQGQLSKYGFDDQFDYYPTLDRLAVGDGHRDRAWKRTSGRSMSSARSLASNLYVSDNDNASTGALNEHNKSIDEEEETKSNKEINKYENKKTSKFNIFKGKKKDETGNIENKRKSSNNNTVTVQRIGSDTTTSESEEGKDKSIAVIPMHNDIIFMSGIEKEKPSEQTSIEELDLGKKKE